MSQLNRDFQLEYEWYKKMVWYLINAPNTTGIWLGHTNYALTNWWYSKTGIQTLDGTQFMKRALFLVKTQKMDYLQQVRDHWISD